MKKLSPGQFVGAREGIEIEKEKERKAKDTGKDNNTKDSMVPNQAERSLRSRGLEQAAHEGCVGSEQFESCASRFSHL